MLAGKIRILIAVKLTDKQDTVKNLCRSSDCMDFHVVNIDDIDGKRIDTKESEMDNAAAFDGKVNDFRFQTSSINDGKNLFTQTLNYVKELLHNPFTSENFFYPTHFSSVPTPM